MFSIIDMEFIHEVARQEARKIVSDYDKKQKAKYGRAPVITIKSPSDIDIIKNLLNNGTCHVDTDSTKNVSRETFKLDTDELEVLLNVARMLNGECGQLGGDCSNCLCHCDKEVLGSNCLINQIHEIRRKYS